MLNQMQGVLSKFNWVDILTLLLFLRSCFIGSKKGFITELFKVFGLLIAIYISLHYFSQASGILTKWVPFLGVTFADFLCFVTLAILPYVSVALFRIAVLNFVKVEAANLLDKWGGFSLGIVKAYMAVSLLFIGFYFLNVSYLKESLKRSYLGSKVVNTDVKIYQVLVNGVVSKFAPRESFNNDLYEVLEEDKA